MDISQLTKNSNEEKMATATSDPLKFLLSLTRKDIREASVKLTNDEARFLVDYYYIAQEDRKRFKNQERSMGEEPIAMLAALGHLSEFAEKVIQKALDDYTKAHPVGQWMRAQHGVGPVISAGLLAHIDISRAPTAGHIWSFAGLNPNVKWEKGQKRPFNADFKKLCYLIGECFVKTCNSDKSYYGKMYAERKKQETEANERGDYKEKAAQELATKNYSKNTETYGHLIEGRLSPAHIHARARRYAVKMFLSHLHHVMYVKMLGVEPPKPFALAHLGHVHIVPPPYQELIYDSKKK